MKTKYICQLCGYEYDPRVGDPENDIEPGTELDELPELVSFADKLESACIKTLTDGIMTKDLVGLVDEGVKVQAVNSLDFLRAIRERLEASL